VQKIRFNRCNIFFENETSFLVREAKSSLKLRLTHHFISVDLVRFERYVCHISCYLDEDNAVGESKIQDNPFAHCVSQTLHTDDVAMMALREKIANVRSKLRN
jgi:hypothetical protein